MFVVHNDYIAYRELIPVQNTSNSRHFPVLCPLSPSLFSVPFPKQLWKSSFVRVFMRYDKKHTECNC